MTVYVDQAGIPFRGMLMCHLFADSKKELHEFAARLRLHKWSYQRGETLAHYQVSMSQRRRALELGAVAVTPEWRRERIRAETEKILKRSAPKPRSVLGLKVPLA